VIIPSIDLQSGRTVQLVGGRDLAIDAGDPLPIAQKFSLAGEIALIDLDAAIGTGSNANLVLEVCRTARCRVGGGIRDTDTAIRWLDAGASKVILGTAAKPEILRDLPRERVIAALDADKGEVVVEGWRRGTGATVLDRMHELRGLVSGFLVTFVEREGRMTGTNLDLVPDLVKAAGDARVTIAGGVTTIEDVRTLDRMGADAQVGMALYSGKLDLADAIAAPLSSDRADGLWPTVVVDELGVALGLAYSSAESVREAVRTRRGVYHSRTRGLWVKGASSGNTQELLRVDLDCDRDALRFTVRQRGEGFCHNNTTTCWGPARGLAALEERIAAQAAAPSAGSYSARLLADPALLRAKLVEEAGELGEAAANGTSDAAANEAADVLYFAMVAARRAGVPLANVADILDKRALKVTRRPGNAKPGAIAALSPEVPANAGGTNRVLLRPMNVRDVLDRRASPVDAETINATRGMIDEIGRRGDACIREFAERFGDIDNGAPVLRTRGELDAARERLPAAQRELLERVAGRVRGFAEAQRRSLTDVCTAVPGGVAGHRVVPVKTAGCYAPGGRFPLPSSVLMTAITARAAGVQTVVVASPKPTDATLAAAAIAGADLLLCIGGVQAIAACAMGLAGVPRCDMIVGPGNRWVTAAKFVLSDRVGIDMLAGPSELTILADASADAGIVAADLLAQAEHDPDAVPILVTTDATLPARVERELSRQLEDLPTREIALQSLRNGGVLLAGSIDEAAAFVDAIAPEHLEILTRDANETAARIGNAGAIFVGANAAEVVGDYGIGPNHTLPTGGTARFRAGLSVFSFLRARTYIEILDPAAAQEIYRDSEMMARIEALEGHARAAGRRVREAP
jgi:histidinol dehydrogenase/phosphoribosyl-ATP pyrophosphohydrolase